jgi:hypothetical protein
MGGDGGVGGREVTRVIYDEMAAGPRRELIVVREDGRTHSVDAPAPWDLGEVLLPGEVVGFDGGERLRP